MRRLAVLAMFLVATVMERSASAHKPSDAYLTLSVSGGTVEVRWDIALRDLHDAIGLDDDGDGNVTWGELRAHEADVARLARERLSLSGDGRPCIGDAPRLRVTSHSDGGYAVLEWSAHCPSVDRALDVDYGLLFDLDRLHRGLARIDFGDGPQAVVFSAESRHLSLPRAGVSRGAQLGRFVKEGIHHIGTGYDHLLFLVALLLPAVLRREDEDPPKDASESTTPHAPGWRPIERFRPALLDVLRVVTSFTVAHSITLSLSALDLVRLPSRLVESGIALSVVVAALNNVVPILRRGRWKAAFALGLLHGFAFSAALVDLGLTRSRLVPALFGFNLGVEIGQLAVVALVLPLAWLARRTRVYRGPVLVGGSAVIAALAAVWLIERAFEIKLL